LRVGGDIRGGVATADGQNLSATGTVVVKADAGDITVGGSVVGADTDGHDVLAVHGAGAIDANGHLGAVRIGGDVVARTERPRISAAGLSPAGVNTGFAIRSLTVLGRVEQADILAGYRQYDGTLVGLNPVNPNARIGSVQVGGDWVASNLCAGVDPSTGDRIAGGHPTPPSRIDSLVVGGNLTGTAATGDRFLMSARQIGQISVAGTSVGPLHAGPGNDDLVFGPTADVFLKEVA
jgi:hypothetical protein